MSHKRIKIHHDEGNLDFLLIREDALSESKKDLPPPPPTAVHLQNSGQ